MIPAALIVVFWLTAAAVVVIAVAVSAIRRWYRGSVTQSLLRAHRDVWLARIRREGRWSR